MLMLNKENVENYILDNIGKEYVSKKIIYDYIKYLVKNNNLDGQVNEININKRLEVSLGSYFPATKTLNVNLNNIIDSFSVMSRRLHANNKEENIRFYNLIIMQIINHEIVHAIQTKISEEAKDDSLHIIAREGIELGKKATYGLSMKEKITTSFFYHYLLTEKNAEVMSYYHLLKINNEYNIFTLKEQEFIRKQLIKNILIGYSKRQSPVEYYYKLRGKMKEFINIKFDEEYSNLEILSWGMPIKYDDIKNIYKEKNNKILEKKLQSRYK